MKEAFSSRRRNKIHLPWLGLLITLFGIISYFVFFARFPFTRDVPWVNLPIVILGGALALVGSSGRRGLGNKIKAMIFSVLAVALTTLFIAYIFVLSKVPEPTVTSLELEQPMEFSLSDHNSSSVSLKDYADRRLVIAFFRGYW
jgi:hypothetical protein